MKRLKSLFSAIKNWLFDNSSYVEDLDRASRMILDAVDKPADFSNETSTSDDDTEYSYMRHRMRFLPGSFWV